MLVLFYVAVYAIFLFVVLFWLGVPSVINFPWGPLGGVPSGSLGVSQQILIDTGIFFLEVFVSFWKRCCDSSLPGLFLGAGSATITLTSAITELFAAAIASR